MTVTTREILADRVVGVIEELLTDAQQFDDDYSYTRAEIRHELAVSWNTYLNDIPELFRQIYLRSLLFKFQAVDVDVDRVDDLAAVASATDNRFIAPVLLLAAELLDWRAISAECLDLFFDPALMGSFSSCAEAIEDTASDLKFAQEMADTGDDDYDEDGKHYLDEEY